MTTDMSAPQFDASQHPRGEGGRFATKPAAESTAVLQAPAPGPALEDFRADSYLGRTGRATSSGALVRHRTEVDVETYDDGTPYGARGRRREDHVVIEMELHPGPRPGTYVTNGPALRAPIHVTKGPDGIPTFTRGERSSQPRTTTWELTPGGGFEMVESEDWDVPQDEDEAREVMSGEVEEAIEDVFGDVDEELQESMSSGESTWSRRVHLGPNGQPRSMVLELRSAIDLED